MTAEDVAPVRRRGLGSAIRSAARRPGLVVGASILLAWGVFLIWLHLRTHHVSADYPDTFEIIGNFLDP